MQKYLALVVFGVLLLLASRLSAEPRFSSDVVGNFMVNDTLTVNGDGIFNLGAAEKVYLDGTTITHTNTAGLLDINVTTATAGVTSIDVSTTLTADVDNVYGIKSTFISTAAGTTEKVGGPFLADIQGHAGDNDDRIHSALIMTGTKNGGNSNLDALVIKGPEWDNIITAEKGNITFSGYNAVILAEADAPGNGPELRIQAGNGDDNGEAGDWNGGNMYMYGGAKANAGVDGNTVLAHNSATAIGGVGIRRPPVAGEGLGVAGKTVLDGDVEIGGTTTLVDTVWTDLRVSFTEAQPGPANNPGFDVFQGAVRAYHFDPNAEEELFVIVQIPHSYKYGTDLHPHIHWAPTTTNTDPVRWCLEYTLAEVDGTYGAPTTLCENDAADGTAYKHQYFDLGNISGAAIDTLSATLVCRVYRDADDAADDYTGDAVGLELDFHFEKDAFGSDEELTK